MQLQSGKASVLFLKGHINLKAHLQQRPRAGELVSPCPVVKIYGFFLNRALPSSCREHQ